MNKSIRAWPAQTIRQGLLVATALTLSAAFLVPAAVAGPEGGMVSAGAGDIARNGAVTTIVQKTPNLAIDWSSFSTRPDESVVFQQPNSGSIALNRVLGTAPSELLGGLSANGQVFVLNPNGVLIGQGAQVTVGGFAASTLGLGNADFMAGRYSFASDGSAGAVVNRGTITAADGGYAALLAPEVRNEGVVSARLGTALLAAGDKVTLNFDGGSLIAYSIDQGAARALAENRQLIQADGGRVILAARAADRLASAVVNNTGVIEARLLQDRGGRILLLGDMEAGETRVGGTLDASAPQAGDGGFIETSAAHVRVADDARITTTSKLGHTGEWLIDPFDFRIAATGGDITATALQTQLGASNVTLSTTNGTTGTNGDIIVDQAVNWSTNKLTLNAERAVNVNANLTATGGGDLVMNAAAGAVTIASPATVAVDDLTITAVGGVSGNIDATRLNVGNSGAGNIALTHTGAGLISIADLGLGYGARNTATGGGLSLDTGADTSTGSISLVGTSVSAAGGDITLKAQGYSTNAALNINTASIATTGAGKITLYGDMTGGPTVGDDVAMGGITAKASSIATGSGAIAFTGKSAFIINGDNGRDGTGVRLEAVTLTTTGALSIDGRATARGGNVNGSNQTIYTSDNGGLFRAAGVQVVGASALQAGSIDLYGYQRNDSPFGLNRGVIIDYPAAIRASGAISVFSEIYAPSAATPQTFILAGLVQSTGGTITLRGAGTPAPAPASTYDLSLQSVSTVASGGGDIILIGDRINIGSSVNAGTGTIRVRTNESNRSITLGNGNEQINLNLSNSELGLLTASRLVVGDVTAAGLTHIGGISVESAINLTSIPALSLITQSPTVGFGRGVISGSGKITVGSLSLQAQGVDLTGLNDIGTLSGSATLGAFNVATSRSGGVTIGTVGGVSGINASAQAIKVSNAAGDLTISQALTTTGNVTLSASGAITQSAAIGASGLELLGGGSATLTNAGNAITALAANTGSVSYSQAGALTIGAVNTTGVTATGKVLVRTTGATADLTLANAISAGATADDALVLAAGRNFINSAGATPLATGAGGRFLVYSTDPTANTFGGLVSTGNAFGRTFAANGPASSTITGLNGNRFVYSATPTLTVTAAAKTKVYGQSDPTLTYAVGSGLVTGDTSASAVSGALTVASGRQAVGDYAIGQGTVTSPLGYLINYVGANLSVSAATLAVTATGVNRIYDGTTNATVTYGDNRLSGDSLTIGGTARFADKAAGLARTINVTGITLTGADAGNYTFNTTTTASADIAQAPLTVGATGIDKVFDGTTAASVNYTDNRITGDALSITGTAAFTTAAIGTGKTVNVTGIAASGTAAGNYALTGTTATTSANIVAAPPPPPPVVDPPAPPPIVSPPPVVTPPAPPPVVSPPPVVTPPAPPPVVSPPPVVAPPAPPPVVSPPVVFPPPPVVSPPPVANPPPADAGVTQVASVIASVAATAFTPPPAADVGPSAPTAPPSRNAAIVLPPPPPSGEPPASGLVSTTSCGVRSGDAAADAACG
jgi:filamentous hemagglutinin family protein